MANYTETFTSVSGDSVDASELETQFDAISTAIATKLDSDGSGTLTGVLNMGSNKITTVTDPTSAQDAATKNYVDTGIVSDYVTATGTTISTTEQTRGTLTVTIPSAWASYNVELAASFVADEAVAGATGDTSLTFRFRDVGLGGTILATSNIVMHVGVVGHVISDTYSGSLLGWMEGETATTTRSWVFTVQSGGNSGYMQNTSSYIRVLCYRTA